MRTCRVHAPFQRGARARGRIRAAASPQALRSGARSRAIARIGTLTDAGTGDHVSIDSHMPGEIIATMARRPSRRAFLRISAGAALAPAGGRKTAATSPPAPAPTSAGAPTARVVDSTVVRVASVPTAVEGGLLPALFDGFATRVELVARPDVYEAARAGKVDLVISHYG